MEPQIGTGGFRIDLGIVDPERTGRYLLGIECDGATYHSSRSARDRDRLREQVLVGLGWHLHRVWSTDWFRDPQSELGRIQDAIVRAQQHWAANDRGETPRAGPARGESFEVERVETPDSEDRAGSPDVPHYEAANVKIELSGQQLHELPTARLVESAMEIVGIEGPVHRDVVTARITRGAGLSRTGRRIKEAVARAIEKMVQDRDVRCEGDFLSLSGSRDVIVRDRTLLDAADRRWEWISDTEIEAAIVMVVTNGYSVEEDEATALAMSMLGIKRRANDLQLRLSKIVAALIDDCRREPGRRQATSSECVTQTREPPKSIPAAAQSPQSCGTAPRGSGTSFGWGGCLIASQTGSGFAEITGRLLQVLLLSVAVHLLRVIICFAPRLRPTNIDGTARIVAQTRKPCLRGNLFVDKPQSLCCVIPNLDWAPRSL